MTTNKINLSTKQICAIIKLCNKAGVSSLSYEGLNITLHRNESNEKAPISQAVGQTVPLPINTQSERITKDELNAKDIELEELYLTDPLAYEEMLIRGELEG